jgi:hypothetical protein
VAVLALERVVEDSSLYRLRSMTSGDHIEFQMGQENEQLGPRDTALARPRPGQRAGWIKAEVMGQLNLRVRKLHAQSSESDGLPSLCKLQGVEDIWFDG